MILIKHIRVDNVTNLSQIFRLYKNPGANIPTAGAEIYKDVTVPAYGFVEQYPPNMRLDQGEFLGGYASLANSLNLSVQGEIGIA